MKPLILILFTAASMSANALICQNANTYVTFSPITSPEQAPFSAAVIDHGISGNVTCVTDSTAHFQVSATCYGVLSRARTGFAYDPVEIKLSFSTSQPLDAKASIASTFPDGKTPGPFTDLLCED